MNTPLSAAALDQLFLQARSIQHFAATPVSQATLEQLFTLAIQGPTAVNSLPMRLVFVQSPEAKARLKPYLSPGNVDKTLAAPITVIVAMDHDFPEQLPRYFPFADARSWYVGNPTLTAETAFRNSSLQGAYVLLAARALGLAAGPMSGFDAAGVDAEFFAGTQIRSNFLINLGYADGAAPHPRAPRPTFGEVAQVL